MQYCTIIKIILKIIFNDMRKRTNEFIKGYKSMYNTVLYISNYLYMYTYIQNIHVCILYIYAQHIHICVIHI